MSASNPHIIEDEPVPRAAPKAAPVAVPVPTAAETKEAIRCTSRLELEALVLKLWATSKSSHAVVNAAMAKYIIAEDPTCKRRVMATCQRCHKHYDPAQKDSLICIAHHPGEKEVDDESDTWVDHDEDCHCDPWHPTLMKDPCYKDGCIMSCCDKRPYEAGCELLRHLPETEGQPAKRARSGR